VIKLVVGILKGAVIGGAVGYGAYALGTATGFANPWLTYGVIGALVGLFAGRPIWSLIRDKNATSWVSILKAAFGFGIGCGLYALVSRVIHPPAVIVGGENVFTWPVTLGGAIGELDDAIGDDKDKASKKAAVAKKPAAKT
jgi:Na+/proline symporter